MLLDESPKARQAWADYVALGPGRSLEALVERYQTEKGSGRSVPSVRLATLADWSRSFGWQARLQAQADRAAAEAEAEQRRYIRSIMEEGFGLAHERVRLLKELADKLRGELLDGGRLWVEDVKGIGQGERWQTVPIERFNSAEVEQLRGILDDIAKETGGRPKTVKVDIEAKVRLMARSLGLDPDAAVAEAQRILAEGARAAG